MIKLEGGLVDESSLINLQELYSRLQWQKKNNFPDEEYKQGKEESVEYIKENFDSAINEIERAIDDGYDFLGMDEDGTQVYLKSSEINLQ
tara:strand:- start:59 stop:328 length:270 start_codon:yes stop_codon:yes gene_type:complete